MKDKKWLEDFVRRDYKVVQKEKRSIQKIILIRCIRVPRVPETFTFLVRRILLVLYDSIGCY